MTKRLLWDRECDLWPYCGCAETLSHFRKALDTESYTWEQIQWISFSIGASLACVETHCPDLEMRAYAKRELLDPFWRFAYEGREVEMEDFEEFRRRARG
jgi:hypothetical protein